MIAETEKQPFSLQLIFALVGFLRKVGVGIGVGIGVGNGIGIGVGIGIATVVLKVERVQIFSSLSSLL